MICNSSDKSDDKNFDRPETNTGAANGDEILNQSGTNTDTANIAGIGVVRNVTDTVNSENTNINFLVRIENRSLFRDTSAYICEYKVAHESILLNVGLLDIDVIAGDKRDYVLTIPKPELAGEYVVIVSLKLRDKTIWADQYHEVAVGQCVYKVQVVSPKVEYDSATLTDVAECTNTILSQKEDATCRNIQQSSHNYNASSDIDTDADTAISVQNDVYTQDGDDTSMRNCRRDHGESIKQKNASNSVIFTQAPEHILSGWHIIEGDCNIGVEADGFFAMLTKDGNGGLVSLKYDGHEYITRAPKLTFWRAPTDNDDGFGLGFRSAIWRTAGVYARKTSYEWAETEDGLQIDYVYALPITASGQPVQVVTSDSTAPIAPEIASPLEVHVTYIATRCGKVKVYAHYPGAAGLPDIPTFGIDFKLRSELDTVQFYGYGPDENYIDRAEGATLGVYSYDVASNLAGYLNPQESGNRTGVRWLEVKESHAVAYQGRPDTPRQRDAQIHDALQGDRLSVSQNTSTANIQGKANNFATRGISKSWNNIGLRFTAEDTPFESSVLNYTEYELENAMHISELPPVHYSHVRILAKQMGVGGDDSWGAPVHDEYLIHSEEPLTVAFAISKL
ncbi:MAG: DUF4981 domain-containing protein [Clostridiales Family XIII bacterium]|nr:DUF4981 domain-containing protein [Clostridiales Family XIII bacterium]